MLASFGDLYGEPVTLSELPDYLPQAVIATEDRRFYRHPGFDPIGILRAIYVNIREGRLVQGGSSITQQLAKNVFLTRSEEHTSELQSLMRISYAVFCLKKKTKTLTHNTTHMITSHTLPSTL